MTAPLKLSELVAARAAMTPEGEWSQHEMEVGGNPILGIKAGDVAVVYMPDNMESDDNAAGIVATHNAADVLIEIAQAALAWRAARDKGGAAMWDDKAASAIMTATEILRDALDKIEP